MILYKISGASRDVIDVEFAHADYIAQFQFAEWNKMIAKLVKIANFKL